MMHRVTLRDRTEAMRDAVVMVCCLPRMNELGKIYIISSCERVEKSRQHCGLGCINPERRKDVP